MATRTLKKEKLPPVQTSDSQVWTIGRKDGEFLKVVTINTAFQVLKEDQNRGLFPRDDREFTTWVDGNPRKVEVQVKFGGSIWYVRNQQLSEVYQWIWQRIQRYANRFKARKKYTKGAPFRRRRYSQSNIVMVDRMSWINVGEGRAGLDLQRAQRIIKPNSEVRFVNVQPYAKRIEHGSAYQPKYLMLGKRKGVQRTRRVRAGPHKGQRRNYTKLYWSADAKRGIYQVVAREAARKFRGVAQIDYRRMQMPQIGYQFRHGGQRVDQFYPVIRVRADRSGTSRVK